MRSYCLSLLGLTEYRSVLSESPTSLQLDVSRFMKSLGFKSVVVSSNEICFDGGQITVAANMTAECKKLLFNQIMECYDEHI